MGRRLTPPDRSRALKLIFAAVSAPAFAMLAASLIQPAVGGDFGAALERFLGLTCHRLPRRCLPLPWGTSGLCARCTAYWAGLGTGTFFTGASGGGLRHPLAGLALTAPMALDGLLQAAGLYESLNVIRVATGLAGGWGTGIVLVWLFSTLLWSRSSTGDRTRGNGSEARGGRA